MKKTVWDVFAPFYERSMRSQQQIYDYIYQHASLACKGKKVLELATGPGMIAKNIASSAESVVATDFAPKMIKAAKKGGFPDNVVFETADATALKYADKSFDVVIIASALHIMPNPGKAMSEISRVLCDDGLLVAPNFIFDNSGKKNLWQKFLSLIGIKFAHEWTAREYMTFLESNGWEIKQSEILNGRINLLYVECKRKRINFA